MPSLKLSKYLALHFHRFGTASFSRFLFSGSSKYAKMSPILLNIRAEANEGAGGAEHPLGDHLSEILFSRRVFLGFERPHLEDFEEKGRTKAWIYQR